MPAPLLVSNLTNIRYLSGVHLTDGLMLVRKSAGARHAVPLLFVDSRYTEKAADEAKRGIKVLHRDELPKWIKRLKKVRFEANDVTVTRLQKWKKIFRGTQFIPSEGVIEELRRAKKKEEILCTKKACRITDKVLQEIPRILRVGAPRQGAPSGMTEKELGWKIEKLSRELGADAMAFETIVAFGPSSSRPHHRPTERRLRKGDLVQIDMGVNVKGYCSDCSRVFFTGKQTPEQKKIFDLLVAIVKDTTKMAKVGAHNTALDKFARKRMRQMSPKRKTKNEKRYDELFFHSLGHGVGLEIHEGINISSRAKKMKLKPNEIVTTEPGVYFEGKWGMRIEDTVLVGKKSGLRLTQAPYLPIRDRKKSSTRAGIDDGR
jgi:Xaa-Pro aminopeptidase